MATPLSRRIAGAAVTLVAAVLAVAAPLAPAHAEDGYQYWSYYHLEGETWAFSEVGPAEYQPEDGAVEGFRYGTSTMSKTIEPRADLSEVGFDAVCEGAEAAEGEKRVAVVLDFGVDEGNGAPPQPRAECAVVPAEATTQEVLDAVADVRVESQMTCAIDGYPATGCGEPVKNAEVPTDEEPVTFALPSAEEDAGTADDAAGEGGTGTSWATIGLVALVVLIAAGAFALTRRNRAS